MPDSASSHVRGGRSLELSFGCPAWHRDRNMSGRPMLECDGGRLRRPVGLRSAESSGRRWVPRCSRHAVGCERRLDPRFEGVRRSGSGSHVGSARCGFGGGLADASGPPTSGTNQKTASRPPGSKRTMCFRRPSGPTNVRKIVAEHLPNAESLSGGQGNSGVSHSSFGSCMARASYALAAHL